MKINNNNIKKLKIRFFEIVTRYSNDSAIKLIIKKLQLILYRLNQHSTPNDSDIVIKMLFF